MAVLLLVWIVSAVPANAGAWLQRPGGLYVKTTLLLFLAQDFYDLQGVRQRLGSNGQFEDFGVYAYGEYGLSSTLTLVATAPYKRLTYRSGMAVSRSAGLADLYLGLKYGLATQPYVLSLQFGLKVAPGYETSPEKLGGAPPLGDGQTDFEMLLLAGRSILKYRGYVSLEVGYRARSGAPVDELPFAAELGYDLSGSVLAMVKLYGVRALAEKASLIDPGLGSTGSLIGTGRLEDFAKAQVQLVYRASPRVELSVLWEQIVSGRNTTAGATFGMGLAFLRK